MTSYYACYVHWRPQNCTPCFACAVSTMSCDAHKGSALPLPAAKGCAFRRLGGQTQLVHRSQASTALGALGARALRKLRR